MNRGIIITITIIVAFAITLFCQQSQDFNSRQTSHLFTRKHSKVIQAKYLIYLPDDYGKTKKQFPLILYLHGGSLRGNDVEKLRTIALPHLLEEDPKFPFIVVSPLCPDGEIWTDTEMLNSLIDNVISHYAVDKSRIYLTGHSMGGRGVLYLAFKFPERFAAIISLSPYSTIPFWANKLKNIPIWFFQGDKDKTVPLTEVEALVNSLKAEGDSIKFTVLKGRDHFILDVYENKQIFQWLLGFKKAQR